MKLLAKFWTFSMQRLILIAGVLVLSACATVAPQSERVAKIDPLEGFNRGVFEFNQKLDEYAIKPVAEAYRFVLPEPVRKGITNFFQNILDIYNAGHNLLQGKPMDAVSDIGRFVVNSTLGILGIFDVATDMGLEKHPEDFGQTFAVWGVPQGPYLVLPFFGPSTVRDGVGFGFDIYTDFVLNSDRLNSDEKIGITGLRIINLRANLLDAEQLVDAAAFDRYSFIRDSYLQRRRNQVFDGNPPPLKEED